MQNTVTARKLGVRTSQIGFGALRHVAVGNFANKLGIRIIHHNVEVLNSVNRFERSPILEPQYLPGDRIVSTPHLLIE